MTLTELETLRDALETALLDGASTLSVTHNGRSLTYSSKGDIMGALAQVNRSIARYKVAQRGGRSGFVKANFQNR